MNSYKLDAIALIENLPDDKAEAVLKILKNVCELLSVNSNRHERLIGHAEERLALMEEIENLIGEESDTKDG
ncbi:MAG: hypothetical protein IJR52_12015 [Selenomonadaceae bacterium]|nr:hypothetical protein [Selenomonadaceae bacterium]